MAQFVSVTLQSVACLSFRQQCPKRVISHGCSETRGGGIFFRGGIFMFLCRIPKSTIKILFLFFFQTLLLSCFVLVSRVKSYESASYVNGYHFWRHKKKGPGLRLILEGFQKFFFICIPACKLLLLYFL